MFTADLLMECGWSVRPGRVRASAVRSIDGEVARSDVGLGIEGAGMTTIPSRLPKPSPFPPLAQKDLQAGPLRSEGWMPRAER